MGCWARMLSSVSDVCFKALAAYKRETDANPKLVLIDAMMTFSISTAAIQITYLLLAGSFPFNSFLASLLCCVGVFAFTASLRLQCTSSEFHGMKGERTYGGYALCCLVLFFIVFSYIG